MGDDNERRPLLFNEDSEASEQAVLYRGINSEYNRDETGSLLSDSSLAYSPRDKASSDYRSTLHDETDPNIGSSADYRKAGPSQKPLHDLSSDKSPLLSGADAVESEIDRKQRWWSIRIMYLAMFFSSVAFSILIASLSPFLTLLSPKGESTNSFLGYVVAAYSIGQFASSPFFGWWANRAPYKWCLFVSILINVSGNMMYCLSNYTTDDNEGQKYVMLIARLVVGLSAGNVAITRAYVAGATHLSERTHTMSMLSACQTGGFVVGPLLGSAFSSIDPGVRTGPLIINYCTAPALFSVFLGIIQAIIVLIFFREYRLDGGAVSRTTVKADAEARKANSLAKAPNMMPMDKLAVGLCVFMFFLILFVFALYETIGTPLTKDEYSWSDTEATRYVGILFGVSGGIGVLIFMVVKPLSARFGDRKTMIAGMLLVVIGFIFYLPFGPPSYTPCPNDKFGWCDHTPTLPLAQYIVACTFISLGYPVVTVLLFIIYSKVLGPGPQGTYMGILTAAGSLARVLGPLFITNAWDAAGPYAAFAPVLGLLVIMTVTALVFYKRLIPRRALTTM
ncbi:major facilitator superfamily transporter domain containing 8 [Capsaspora owczarzaki ATCC 30864]|nr:major facilitator superfamily transporter domain containing 8 [Capsaspora owczarzaki ATCC 30864]|eukprot:XP_004363322.1 major facilitator superfamily transporter domain containing 8 [Capsaspora owczarzaki ATCC 30864]